MRCPRCGSEYCQLVSETEVKTKGYGVGSGCCGYILFGPLGLLCGLCGIGDQKTKNKHFWICTNCSTKFKA